MLEEMSFNDTYELAEVMYDMACDEDQVTAVLYYNEASSLMKELLKYNEIRPIIVELDIPNYFGYKDAYYITVTNEMELFVEKAVRNNEYTNADSTKLFIDGDVTCSVLNANRDSNCTIITVNNIYSRKQDTLGAMLYGS